ncbi:MAG: alpha/beta hydrolase-fold protein, partial [Ruminococcus sp.]
MIQEQITTLTLPYPLGDKRVRVYVPAHEEGETFPVVYMTDGQNLFESENLQFGCWYTREAVAEERAQSGMAAIIVGIHNDDAPWE